MRPSLRSLLIAGAAAGVATAAVVVGGVLCNGDADEPPSGPAPFRTTALADYDTASAAVVRGPFCDSIDDRQVEAALGGPPRDTSEWQNGDRIEVTDRVRDVGQEFGCRFDAADGTVARAWLFAPPVTAEEAARLVRGAGKGAGCTPTDGPAFGEPSLALTCTRGGVTRASFRGLFGDAWVVCELSRPAGATWDVVDRAGRWCVGVLEAAGRAAA